MNTTLRWALLHDLLLALFLSCKDLSQLRITTPKQCVLRTGRGKAEDLSHTQAAQSPAWTLTHSQVAKDTKPHSGYLVYSYMTKVCTPGSCPFTM